MGKRGTGSLIWVLGFVGLLVLILGALGYFWVQRNASLENGLPPRSKSGGESGGKSDAQIAGSLIWSGGANRKTLSKGQPGDDKQLDDDQLQSDRSFVIGASRDQWVAAVSQAKSRGQQPVDIEILEHLGETVYSGIFVAMDGAHETQWDLDQESLREFAESSQMPLIDLEMYRQGDQLRWAAVAGPTTAKPGLWLMEQAGFAWPDSTELVLAQDFESLGIVCSDAEKSVLDLEIQLDAGGNQVFSALVAASTAQWSTTVKYDLNNQEIHQAALQMEAEGHRMLEVEAIRITNKQGLNETRFAGIWLTSGKKASFLQYVL